LFANNGKKTFNSITCDLGGMPNFLKHAESLFLQKKAFCMSPVSLNPTGLN